MAEYKNTFHKGNNTHVSKGRQESVSSALGMFLQRRPKGWKCLAWDQSSETSLGVTVCLGQPKDSGRGEQFWCIHLRNKSRVPFTARGLMPGVPSEGPFELEASLEGEWQRREKSPPGSEGQQTWEESPSPSVDKGMLQLCSRNQHTPKPLLCGQTF